MLAVLRAMAAIKPGRILVDAPAGFTQGDALAAGVANPGGVSANRSGLGMAPAPALVHVERDGGSVGSRLCAGRERYAVSLPGQAAGAQGRLDAVSQAALGRTVRRLVRRAAVRSDQHILRERHAAGSTGQASIRLQPRQARRLSASRDWPDRHPGRLSLELRSAGR